MPQGQREPPAVAQGLFGLRKVGFLQTHPSDHRRIAHILNAVRDAEVGVPLKVHVRDLP